MKRTCSHCHLEYTLDSLYKTNIDGRDEFFCCKGCEGVFRILKENNLGSFYDKLGQNTLSPPKDYNDDLDKFDTQAFMKKYIKELDNGKLEVSLIITQIHCIACVWLNQKVLRNTYGILEVDINYTNSKAKIIYDSHKITLGQIIEKIRSIGYDAMIYDPKNLEILNNKERRDYYTRMIIGVFCTMNIMWIAVAQYLGYFLGMEKDIKNILNVAAFCLATPTLFYSGWIFFRSGYYGIKNGFINMDLLVAIGASLTYLYSIYAAITDSGETYFESVTMIITFIFIGKFLEVRGRKNAGDKIDSLTDEIPSFVNVLRNGISHKVAPESVQIDDIICVNPGEKIAIDGILLSDNALLDSSMLTGESAFVSKNKGDEILSGSINLEYYIRYQATKLFSNSTMNNIINLIQESINKKPDIQNKANAISYHFSAFIFLVAITTFVVWAILSDIQTALVVAVSVIVIACPCALALATPIATIVGITQAYKNKLLFKEARFLETLAKTNAIVLDKTGTLTYGKPKVLQVDIFDELGQWDKNLLSSFVSHSNHPVSKGILEYLGERQKISIDNFKEITQKGLSANYQNQKLLGGSYKFMLENNITCQEPKDLYMSFYFAINGRIKARFILEDKLKENAKSTIARFLKDGFRVVILSGDRKEVVEKIAKILNVSEYYFEQTPQDKSNFIDSLHKNGYINIMVGDGINDAIALNKSDIAISMGQGSDIAIESSDIILLDNSLESLLKAYNLAKITYRVIRQNIKISIIYNLLTIPLATLGYIIPLFAALSMSFSSLLVTLNSLKISKIKL